MKNNFFLAYGIFAYLSFLAALFSVIGFGGNLVIPEKPGALSTIPFLKSIIINVLLIVLVIVQVYVSAKLVIKKQLAIKLPEPLERSTVVLLVSSGVLVAVWLWQPMGGIIWMVKNGAIKNLLLFLYFLGWSLVIISTFLVYHLDIFGLKQVWCYRTGKPYQHPVLMKPVFLRFARHPFYFGFLVACWSVPVMTGTHLLFACVCSGYVILVMKNTEYDFLITRIKPNYTNYSNSKEVDYLEAVSQG